VVATAKDVSQTCLVGGLVIARVGRPPVPLVRAGEVGVDEVSCLGEPSAVSNGVDGDLWVGRSVSMCFCRFLGFVMFLVSC
jgi:hypothetical protein